MADVKLETVTVEKRIFELKRKQLTIHFMLTTFPYYEHHVL